MTDISSADIEDSGQGESEVDHPSYDDINVPVVVMVGILSAVFTFLMIAFVQGLYNHWKAGAVDEQLTKTVDVRRANLIAEQENQLLPNEFGRLSIEDGMSKALEQYRNLP